MKKHLLTLILLLSAASLQAQTISYIETTEHWYYIYDQDGKKTRTLSTTIGALQGFSATFFVVRNSAWYYIYDATGKKTKTLSASTVGTVLSVAGDTFTSRLGHWIYTWSKEGKKLSTRAAQ